MLWSALPSLSVGEKKYRAQAPKTAPSQQHQRANCWRKLHYMIIDQSLKENTTNTFTNTHAAPRNKNNGPGAEQQLAGYALL